MTRRFAIPFARLALVCAVLALAACTPAPKMISQGPDVSSNISDGSVGKIELKSWNASMASLMAGTLPYPTVPVQATLTLPKNATGRVPAAILLHDLSGVAPHQEEMAKYLNAMGMAALVIDSYSSRGATGDNAPTKSPYPYRVADAYAGLKLLSTHPAIDPNRIVLIGYSAGGAVTLLAISGQARRATVGDGGPRFAGYVSFYPHCAYQYQQPEAPGVPILMLLGGADNITLPQICQDYALRLQAKGADVKVVVYPGAYHAFDVVGIAGKVKEYKDLPNLTNCGDRVLQVEPGGSIYATWLKRSEQSDLDFGDPDAGCQLGGGRIGGPPEARTQALAELSSFLKKTVGAK